MAEKSPMPLFSICFPQSKKSFPLFFWQRVWVEKKGRKRSGKILCVESWSREHHMLPLSCTMTHKSAWIPEANGQTPQERGQPASACLQDKSLACRKVFQRGVTTCTSCCETPPKVHLGCCWRTWQSKYL